MNDISELMRRATDDLDTDTDAESILRRSIDDGVRQRRRRTAGICLASASALVLTGAATVTVQQAGMPAPDSAPPVAGTLSPRAGKPPTSRDTLATLQAVLPAGLQTTAARHWQNSPSWHDATIIVDDGRGASRITVILSSSTPWQCQPDTTGSHCQVLPDGSILSTESRPVYADKPDGVISNTAMLRRHDGVLIELTCYNARDEKGFPKTRPQPLFSLAQLSTMVQSKLWKAPAPYTPPTDPPKRPR